MGWTFYGRTPADPRQELQRLCTWSNDNGTARVLADAMKGSTWYAAVETVKPDGSRLVWGAVFLTSRRDGWGYKDMDESCGPNESECPARILDLLSPLPDPEGRNKFAADWRARCRANLAKPKAKPVKAGDIVKFVAPYTLPSGPCDTFRAVAHYRNGKPVLRFATPDGAHGPYRLANWRKLLVAA